MGKKQKMKSETADSSNTVKERRDRNKRSHPNITQNQASIYKIESKEWDLYSE